MKLALSLILLCFVSSVQAEEQTRTYFIMNLEKGGSTQKFEEMFSQCGGVAVEKINEGALIAKMTIQQGICVAEKTKKIIIQITHRD